ncbi:MAG: bicyclomycin resistance protein [Betaproteobacteria bacterium]|nr:bicyclomycin resistance protein [Betaproteobacteria bacterium]
MTARPDRRKFLHAAGAAALGLQAPLAAAQATGARRDKVLRYAFRIAESGFDPGVFNDYYSNTIAANIFESPLRYDYLSRPARVRPSTAAAMPEISADFKTYVVRLRPGIYFDDHPAFGGKKRELVAEDYVYALKRMYDPRWKSQKLFNYEPEQILDLGELRKEAMRPGGKFDYARPIEGIKALDRYTFQIKFAKPSPRFVFYLASPGDFAAIAREVVDMYGDAIGEHPVGTGPFRLAQWKRSSKIVLERNPNYRDEFFDEQPAADDALAQRIAVQLKGRKLPLVDRVEVSIIEENQPRWLAFLGGEQDMVEEVPADFANIVMPNNQLAPNLAKRGMVMDRYRRADLALTYFNMKDPVVGGNAPEKVALRRAISLGYDETEEIVSVRRGQAIIAQGAVPPETFGYDPGFKTEMGLYDPARAKALLDMYGYVDRNGDGWRELPDGSPLELHYATQPDQQSRQLNEQWKKNMSALGIKMVFDVAKWPEQLKQARAGKLQMWGFGWNGGQPDPDGFVGLGYSPNAGQSNLARFKLAELDRLYELQKTLPDNAERAKVLGEISRLMVVYAPYKFHCHRVYTDLYQPWVSGAKRNIFVRDFWRYIDIDADRAPLRT